MANWKNRQNNGYNNFSNNFNNKQNMFGGKQQNSSLFNFQLVDSTKFLVTGDYEAFCNQKKAIIKAYQGFWSPNDKGWLVPLKNKQELSAKLKRDFKDFQIKDIPDFAQKAIKKLQDKITVKDGSKLLFEIKYYPEDRLKDLSCLPVELKNKLYAYQKKGIQFGLENLGRVLIADEMGVGKTVQSLCLAYCYQQHWPLLVLCPSSLKFNWRDEIIMWLPGITLQQVQVIKNGKEAIQRGVKIIIISYDLSIKFTDVFKKMQIKVAIADEAHYLKNGDVKRTKSLTPILCRCKHVILLTGTPALARPRELFSLISIIRPDVFNYFREFGNRYCDPKPSRFTKGIEYEGSSNPRELHYILTQTIMIRRLKKDVLTELPPKRRQKVNIQGDNKVIKQITTILEKAGAQSFERLFEALQKERASDQQGLDENYQMAASDGSSILEAFNKCYLLTGKAKIPGIQDYMDELIENDVKFIMFAHHREVLDAIEEYCKKKNQRYIRICGAVDPEKRHGRVKQFQEDEQTKIAVLSITAAGTGLTLTATSNIIFAEMHWTPAVMQQAEDRAHRIGQINCVNCHYLVAQNTIDEKLFEKLLKKFSVVSNILDSNVRQLEFEQEQNNMGAYTKPNGIQSDDDVESINEEKNEMINIDNNNKNIQQNKEFTSNIDFDLPAKNVEKKIVNGMKTIGHFFQPKSSLLQNQNNNQNKKKQSFMEEEYEDIQEINNSNNQNNNNNQNNININISQQKLLENQKKMSNIKLILDDDDSSDEEDDLNFLEIQKAIEQKRKQKEQEQEKENIHKKIQQKILQNNSNNKQFLIQEDQDKEDEGEQEVQILNLQKKISTQKQFQNSSKSIQNSNSKQNSIQPGSSLKKKMEIENLINNSNKKNYQEQFLENTNKFKFDSNHKNNPNNNINLNNNSSLKKKIQKGLCLIQNQSNQNIIISDDSDQNSDDIMEIQYNSKKNSSNQKNNQINLVISSDDDTNDKNVFENLYNNNSIQNKENLMQNVITHGDDQILGYNKNSHLKRNRLQFEKDNNNKITQNQNCIEITSDSEQEEKMDIDVNKKEKNNINNKIIEEINENIDQQDSTDQDFLKYQQQQNQKKINNKQF